jgi:TM2 domain-containing membrane protein YozV
MYKIIGADGKQYGPITPEQLRQWIAEGRAKGETLIQLEGQVEWKALNLFPEFEADLKSKSAMVASSPPATAVPPSTATARASNKLPAGICGILLGSLGVHKFILGYTGAGLIMLLVSVLSCGIAAGIVAIVGLIEGIIYLTKSDEEFVRLYVDGRKEWF